MDLNSRPNRPRDGLTYRPDIDGLRAVAVLLVVFNHTWRRFSGGYVGVDVFFIISGYLISLGILGEINAGHFSLVKFYERRVRRIFPALLVMLLAVWALAYLYSVPAELVDTAKSMLAALGSVSNLLFFHQAGYFAAPSELKPLLHTWSLGVEEQFYIFFPLFLLMVRRWFPHRMKAAIWTTAGISFVAACLWVRTDATAAFFFAPLRAWELLLGTVVSQRYLPPLRTALQRNMASLLGIALILLVSLRYDAQTSFPGLAAVPPCLGAALLIAAGETGGSLVGRILSWRPVVFVGLISYSLYLWHWPILVFQRTTPLPPGIPHLDLHSKPVALIASLVVATLSWRFVETPFRAGRFRPGQRAVFVVNGAVATAIGALAGAAMLSGGFRYRFPREALEVASYSDFDNTHVDRRGVCFIDPPADTFETFRQDTCLRAEPGRRQFLLLGDSHAGQLYEGLSKVFPDIDLLQANSSGCKPFVDLDRETSVCRQLMNFMFTDFLVHHPVDTVLLAGRWTEDDIPEIGRTVEWIKQHGMKVIVFGPMIEYDVPLPRLLAIDLRNGSGTADVLRHRTSGLEKLDRQIAAKARNTWHVQYISFYEDLCATQVEMVAKSQPENAANCPVFAAPDVPLLMDADHFTPGGSVLFAEKMRSRNQLR
jgi:peptidoglycan/LPS O-acetylase OafA/YrhL